MELLGTIIREIFQKSVQVIHLKENSEKRLTFKINLTEKYNDM